MSIQFNPNFEYHFWFWRNNFRIVLDLLCLAIEYDYTEEELESLQLQLESADIRVLQKLDGLYYGKKDVMYMKFRQDSENKQKIHCFIAANSNLKDRIEYTDALQRHCNDLEY